MQCRDSASEPRRSSARGRRRHRDGNLVVIELKRDMTERDTIAQALDYGSWVMNLKGDEIVRIFDNYQRTYHSDQKSVSINETFCSYFRVKEMPEELNESHELVIVGSALIPQQSASSGIWQQSYRVRINGVFFRLFKDEGREYLSRVWLREPTQADAILEDTQAVSEWNGEYYASFGHDPGHRNWEDAIKLEDAIKYGFLSAGGGTWYTQTLRMLSLATESGSTFLAVSVMLVLVLLQLRPSRSMSLRLTRRTAAKCVWGKWH
jgi:hypothetical protein